MNYFSAPLPFDKHYIDYIAKINVKYGKSQINMLYNCLPMNASDYSGFEQLRVTDLRIKSLDDLILLANHAKSSGMDFTYLLNSVNTPNPNMFRKKQDRFRSFLERLIESGITKLRISNTMVADYVICNYPQFTVYSSTSQEYYSLKQYANFFNHFGTIKEVVPSWDVNKNFEFLMNFKKRFPDIKMELMVNEGCIGGCPFRRDHHAEAMAGAEIIKKDRFSCFFPYSCDSLYRADRALYLCMNNIIYPWDIDTYNKYGIYNFKFVGRNSPDFLRSTKYIERFGAYLDGIENIEAVYDLPIIDFNHYTIFNKSLESIKVRDIIEYLPKISFFEKNGDKCSYSCGATCKYCYECADRINRDFINKGGQNA